MQIQHLLDLLCVALPRAPTPTAFEPLFPAMGDADSLDIFEKHNFRSQNIDETKVFSEKLIPRVVGLSTACK